jgi:CubicO group peptidase (beta-lactamase class C family)
MNIHYLLRYLFWNYSDVNDYKKFASQEILNSPSFFSFKEDQNEQAFVSGLLKEIEYSYRKTPISCSLDDLLKSTETTAFIIIRNDSVLFEKYYNNSSRESIKTAFSISKSFTSALIGVAIDEGFIRSEEDHVSDYIPELKQKISSQLTIGHLLSMSAGIRYNAKYYPWADEPKSYYHPDLKNLVFNSTRQEYEPGQYFRYVNYNTILLGIILERATRTNPFSYLQNKIWIPLEMEYPATWSIDSRKNNFAKMDSGINARSIDLAKFGRLFLRRGDWNGTRIISEDWINKSTSPADTENEAYYVSKNYYPYSMFFNDRQLYYKYGWWGFKKDNGHFDYMALGIHGQFIYVCPGKQIIIVRNGKRWGKIDWWPNLFKKIIEKL